MLKTIKTLLCFFILSKYLWSHDEPEIQCHPECSWVCSDPTCNAVCIKNGCNLECEKPTNCPKPICELQCERPACEASTTLGNRQIKL